MLDFGCGEEFNRFKLGPHNSLCDPERRSFLPILFFTSDLNLRILGRRAVSRPSQKS
jgi:hypothetical protein